MAEGEHLSEQTRHLWLADKSTPLEGTAKHPQGRLFNPGGSYTGDPMRLHPSNWLKQGDTPAHSDVISWHGSEESALPREDLYEHRASDEGDFEGSDWNNPYYDDEGEENPDYVDYSVDSHDRPMTNYGSAVGMHFGSLKAVVDRDSKATPRPFVHPARIPEATMAPPPTGGFSTDRPGGSIASGLYRSGQTIVNQETGEKTVDTRWGDAAANYAEKGTDLVEQGKTLAYRNDVEAQGSTSYRTLPETARTWSEDVMQARSPINGRPASEKYGWSGDEHAFRNKPHPALVHLAEKGYDPVVLPKETPRTIGMTSEEPLQMSLPFGNRNDDDKLADALGVQPQTYEQAARVSLSSDVNKASAARQEAFDAGRLWTMRKPTS
jgi:hypothetical protein